MPKFKVGDVIFSRIADTYSPAKILGVDYYKSKANSAMHYHLLRYETTASAPKEEDIPNLPISALHVPVSVEGVDKDSHLITNRPVTNDELQGYHAFLRRTDFNLYLEITGQDLQKIIDEAYGHLIAGRAAHEDMKLDQAIEKYTTAHETLPVLYQAFEDKGFAYMDLGRFDDAVAAFQQSLQINQDAKASVFALGKCMLELGKPAEALRYFERGAQRWPEVTEFQSLLAQTKSMYM